VGDRAPVGLVGGEEQAESGPEGRAGWLAGRPNRSQGGENSPVEATRLPAKKRPLRPPLWVMSVLVAAAVLFYVVENRPVAKHVVSATPAAATESTVNPPTTHKATVKATKPPVTAQQPGTTVGAAALPTYPQYSIAPAGD